MEPGWPQPAPLQVEGDGLGVFDEPSHSAGRNGAKRPPSRERGSPSARIGGDDLSDRVAALTARLRRDCPWDREQTLASMRPYLLEETHEVLEALDRVVREDEGLEQLKEELGDLLFQVYFLAEIAGEQAGGFGIEQVVDGLVRKMIERHPHVFAPEQGIGGGSIAAWEAQKAKARPKGYSRVDGVPAGLPALLRAHRVGEKLAHVGFDWPDVEGVLAKVDEERGELAEAIATGDRAAIVHEYGDLLLACASVGRFLGVSGEDALREANQRFEGRFRVVETLAGEAGVALEEAGPDRLDAWWRQAKAGAPEAQKSRE